MIVPMPTIRCTPIGAAIPSRLAYKYPPVASKTAIAGITIAKNRVNVAAIKLNRCGGSSTATDGRKQKCANTIPPNQMMADDR